MNPNLPIYGLGTVPNVNMLNNMLMANGFEATDQPQVPKPALVPQYTYAQDINHHAMNLVQPQAVTAAGASDPVHVIVYQNDAQQQQPISYAKIPQLGGTAVVQPQAVQQSQPSFVVNSQQPRATVASGSRASQYTAASASSAVTSASSRTVKHVQSPVERKKDILAHAMHGQKHSGLANPNTIDLTLAENKELEDLLNNYEKEMNNNGQLVDPPHPVFIDDYARLGEGAWLNTNILDFYLHHIYNQLPPEKRRNIFIYETTFFSVLGGVDGLNQVRGYFKEINFFDKKCLLIPVATGTHFYLMLILRFK